MKLKINLNVGPVNILLKFSHYQTVVNFCSGNGLLYNATKPLLESVLTILWHLLKEMSQKMLKLFIIKMFLNFFTISRGLISYPLRPGDIYASVVIKAIIGSDNGLLPDWHQATTWIHDILSIRPWRTHFNDILFEIQKFSFKKMHLKTSAKWHTFCLSLNVLMAYSTAELNDKKGVQFICILLTCCVTFLSVYTTQWYEN